MAVIRGYDIRERNLDYRSNYYIFRVPEPICAARLKAAIEEARFEGCNQADLEISMTGQEYFNLVDECKKEGRLEAWDLARRIVTSHGADIYTGTEFDSVFGSHNANTIFGMPADEALAKDKEFQEDKKALHVGDEVEFGVKDIDSFGSFHKKYRGYITNLVSPVVVRILTKEHGTFTVSHEKCKKTGRHSDEIEKAMDSFEKGES